MAKYNSKKNFILGIYLKTDFENHQKVTRRYSNIDSEWKNNYDKKSISAINNDLLRYAFEGNRRLVVMALSNGADINHVEKNANNALILGVYSGHDEVISALLEFAKKNNLNFDINHRNNDQISALHLAVKLNNGKNAKILLTNGAEINLVGKYGKTPIFEAVESNNDEMIELLCSFNANINHKNREGHTPLMVASMNKNRQESFIALLKMNANLYVKDKFGKTALMHACNNGNNVYIDMLLKKSNNFNKLVDEQDYNGVSPLMILAKRGNKEAIRILVSRGANIFLKDKYGRTALNYAELVGNPTCVDILTKAEKIYNQASTISDEKLKTKFLQDNLKIFAKQNRVENSCVK